MFIARRPMSYSRCTVGRLIYQSGRFIRSRKTGPICARKLPVSRRCRRLNSRLRRELVSGWKGGEGQSLVRKSARPSSTIPTASSAARLRQRRASLQARQAEQRNRDHRALTRTPRLAGITNVALRMASERLSITVASVVVTSAAASTGRPIFPPRRRTTARDAERRFWQRRAISVEAFQVRIEVRHLAERQPFDARREAHNLALDPANPPEPLDSEKAHQSWHEREQSSRDFAHEGGRAAEGEHRDAGNGEDGLSDGLAPAGRGDARASFDRQAVVRRERAPTNSPPT